METVTALISALVYTNINFQVEQERGKLLVRVECKSISEDGMQFDTGKTLINALIEEVIREKCPNSSVSNYEALRFAVKFSEDFDIRLNLYTKGE